MRKFEHRIEDVIAGSIAEELEIEPGDVLVSMNHMRIEDIFDYHYYEEEEFLTLLIRKPDGEEWELEIEKDSEEDLGMVFGNSLMDEYHSCHNKCIFCFIDQMPPGMRETLYFKDDDTRLSFLQGNYVSLTNMSNEDLDRIIRYKLAPINISVHTTNPELRVRMLKNRFAGDIMEKIAKLSAAQIPMNSQIVLCKGFNDGEELERSIGDLSAYLPYMESLSVVPIGITKYREGLEYVEPFNKEDARNVIAVIERWQKKLKEQYGNRFVHASDEWYIMAELPIPDAEYYEGYNQLENGVGMMRLFIESFQECFASMPGDDKVREVSLVTAKLAYPVLQELVNRIPEKFPNTTVHLYCIRNDFFGETITVTGLLTGQDMIAQLKGKPLGNKLLIPGNTLKADEDIFLDDITLEDFGKTLQVPVDIVKSTGQDMLEKILGENKNE